MQRRGRIDFLGRKIPSPHYRACVKQRISGRRTSAQFLQVEVECKRLCVFRLSRGPVDATRRNCRQRGARRRNGSTHHVVDIVCTAGWKVYARVCARGPFVLRRSFDTLISSHVLTECMHSRRGAAIYVCGARRPFLRARAGRLPRGSLRSYVRRVHDRHHGPTRRFLAVGHVVHGRGGSCTWRGWHRRKFSHASCPGSSSPSSSISPGVCQLSLMS